MRASSAPSCACGVYGCRDGVMEVANTGSANDNGGRGDWERTGVDVENVDSCANNIAFRLVVGIDKSSSEDLNLVFKTGVQIGKRRTYHLDATDSPLSEQSLIELRNSITCCESIADSVVPVIDSR
jgi:hypothetical protein